MLHKIFMKKLEFLIGNEKCFHNLVLRRKSTRGSKFLDIPLFDKEKYFYRRTGIYEINYKFCVS